MGDWRRTDKRLGRVSLPGFVGFFSDVPGPRDEVLAQVGDYGLGTHHLGAEDVTEDTLVMVQVDGQQLPLEEQEKRGSTLQQCLRHSDSLCESCATSTKEMWD